MHEVPRRFFGNVNAHTNQEIGAFKFGSVIFYQFGLRQIQGLFQWKEKTHNGETVMWPHIIGVPLTYDQGNFTGL